MRASIFNAGLADWPVTGFDAPMEAADLIDAAWQARERAYAPYSHFTVGAALLDGDGHLFLGANVENRSLGLTMCAERVAVGAAIGAGARRIVRIAVVAETDSPISPCGACRQVLAEFGNPEVLLANRRETLAFSLDELLPRASEGGLAGEISPSTISDLRP